MPPDRPEFSRPVVLARVPSEGRAETLVADAAECAALARRFDIPAVAAFRAELRLRSEHDGAVLAEGRLEARVTQSCVVTLEPVEQEVAEPVRLRLLPAGQEPADGPDEADEVASSGGVADLGEALAEQLALALDPYPRAPGAALPAERRDLGAGPFAALGPLRQTH